jgi:hypothetical protein
LSVEGPLVCGARFTAGNLKIVLVILLIAAIRAGYRVRDLRGRWSKRDRTIGIGVLVGSAVLGLLLGVVAHRPGAIDLDSRADAPPRTR